MYLNDGQWRIIGHKTESRDEKTLDKRVQTSGGYEVNDNFNTIIQLRTKICLKALDKRVQSSGGYEDNDNAKHVYTIKDQNSSSMNG